MGDIADFLKTGPSTQGGDIASFLGSTPRSALGEIGNQLAAGVAVDLPEQAGQALQFTGSKGDTLYDAGTRLREYSKANDVGYEPRPDDHNVVVNSLASGARMIPPSVAPAVLVGGAIAAAPVELPAAAAIGLGALATGSVYGASQGQQTYEKGIAAGLPEDQAKEAGRINALIEGAGETAGTYFGGKLLGLAGRAVSKTAGRTAGQAALDAAKDTSVIKPFLKSIPEVAAVETATEIAQNSAEAGVERAYGIPGESPVDAGIGAIAPTLGMTALMAPFGLAGHGLRARRAQGRMDALADPTRPVEQRAQYADQIASELEQADPNAAAAWRENAAQRLANNQPITLDDAMLAVRPPTPATPAPAVPQSTPAAVVPSPAIPTEAAPVTPMPTPQVHPEDAAAIENAMAPDAGAITRAAGVAALSGATAQSRAEAESAARIEAARQAAKAPAARIDQGPIESASPQIVDFESELAHQEVARQAERQRQADLERLHEESRLPAQLFDADVAARMEPAEPPRTAMQIAMDAARARRQELDERASQQQPAEVPSAETTAPAPAVEQSPATSVRDFLAAAAEGRSVALQARMLRGVADLADGISSGRTQPSAKIAQTLRTRADSIERWDPPSADAIRTFADHVDAIRPKSGLELRRLEAQSARTVQTEPTQQPAAVDTQAAALADALQNRTRDTIASAAQMQGIAANPNPKLLMASPTMSDGAPVVTNLSGRDIIPARQLGSADTVIAGKREIPMRYAVVEANSLSPSNFVDGSRNADYGRAPDKLTAINNGRAAALAHAYATGKAGGYRAAIEGAQAVHGIPASTIASMRAPVLVRVIDRAHVTPNIGDESNTPATLALSATEQARNDAARFDFRGVEYADDGRPTDAAVRGFIAAMPASEQQQLAPGGVPTKQAIDRMTAATFHSAYRDPALVELMAQSADPEARNVLAAMTRAAAPMAALEGAGDLDIRPIVSAAAGKVVNAVRSGVSLQRFLQTNDLLEGSAEHAIAMEFARNSRSPRLMGEFLSRLAQTAREEADRAGTDIFGEVVPLRSAAQIIQKASDDTSRQTDLEQQGRRGTRAVADGTQAYDPAGSRDNRSAAQVRRASAVEAESVDSARAPTSAYNPDQSNLFDPNQQSLFADPYEKVETRPNTRPEQLDAGREALAAAERRIFGAANSRRGGASAVLVGSRISKGFREQGGVSLVGQEVRGARDLATIAQVLRDPRFETFRVFYIDRSNKIIGEAAYSSRLPGAVYLPEGAVDRIRRDKARLARGKSGEVGYWLLHNHPRGFAAASDADRFLTRHISDSIPGFAGHVVIDNNEYHALLPDGTDRTYRVPELQSIALADADHEAPHPLLGRPITSAAALADMGKELERKNGFVTIVATGGPRGTVGLITEIPVGVLKATSKTAKLRLLAAVRRATLQTGSGGSLFAVTPDDARQPAYALLRESKLFTDIISAPTGASMRTEGLMDHGVIPVTARDTAGGKSSELPAWYARESEPTYQAEPPSTHADNPSTPTQGKQREALIDSISGHLQDFFKTQKTIGLWGSTVGTMRGIAYAKSADGSWKHRDFKAVYDRVQRYIESTSRFAMRASDLAQSILPRTDNIPAAFRNVMTARVRARDTEKVQAAIWEGTLIDQREYGADELMGRGFTPQQSRMYQETRAAINKSLTDLASTEMYRVATAANIRTELDPHSGIDVLYDHFLSAGKEQIGELREHPETAGEKVKAGDQISTIENALIAIRELKKRADQLIDEGYAPLMRFGRYVVDVYHVDENGKIRRDADGNAERENFQMFDSERHANASARAMRELYKGDPSVRVVQSIVNPDAWKQFQGMTPETVMLFAKQTGMSQTEAYREYLALAVSQRSALQRMFQQRKGIAGYSEELPRVLAAFITSNARRASTNIHLDELARAVSRVRNGEEQRMAQALADYVQNPKEEASWIRGFLFIHFLSGSLASAITNVTGGALMLAPYLQQYTQGTKINLSMVMARATRMAISGTQDAEMARAARLAAEYGLTAPMETHQLHAEAAGSALGRNPYLRSGLHVLAAPFSAAETFNRRLSFFAAYQIAKALQHHDPMQFAADTIAATQGVYNKGNRPVLARGAVGATVFTFKQFAIAYGEFLMQLPVKQRSIALAALVAASGLRGIPFEEDAEDLIDTLMQALGYNFTTKAQLHKWATKVLGETAGQVALQGMTAIPGMPIDVQQRLGFGNMVPGTSLLKRSETDKTRDIAEAIGPVGGVIKGTANAAGQLLAGNVGRAAQSVSPVAVQNVIKAIDMGTTGFYHDERGRRVVAVDFGDAVSKGIGFTPQTVGAESRLVGEQYQSIALHRTVEADIASKWANGIAMRDPDEVKEAMSDLQTWNRDNPDSRITITPAQIQSRVREMNLLRQQRFIKGAPPEIRGGVSRELRE